MTTAHDLIEDTILTHRLIPTELLNREAELILVKWPGYRFMTPMQATRYFLDVYEALYTEFYRTNIDATSARPHKTTIWDTTQRNRAMTQLWEARQRADELGLPYEAVMRFAFEFHYGRISRGKQPLQLFPLKVDNPTWHKMFEKKHEDLLDYHIVRDLDSPIYRNENFLGLPAQLATRELIKSFAMKRSRTEAHGVARYVLERRLVTPDDIAEVIPVDRFDEVMSEAKREFDTPWYNAHPIEQVDQSSTLQTCFALQPTASPTCDMCPHTAKCHDYTQRLRRKAEHIYGPDGLADSHTKLQARERKRKSRENQRKENKRQSALQGKAA